MSRFLETIKVFERRLYNIELHNERFNRTRREMFGITEEYDLGQYIHIPANLSEGLYKCRVLYGPTIESIEFIPYQRPTLRTLRLVRADSLAYSYKSADRQIFRDLKKGIAEDDILIVKNNLLTDCSFANIVFYDGRDWYTPDTPLLYGTKRALLLKEGKIKERRIAIDDVWHFHNVTLINALLDLEDNCSVPTSAIVPSME